MDKKKISQSINDVLGDPDYKFEVLSELHELSSEITRMMKYEEESSKTRVLNLLLINAYRSFNSYITLLENNHFNDSFLLTRKIAEILIRMEYLSKTNTFDNYLREKSIEQAQMLHALIHSHNIKHISQSALWKIRHKIIADCKAIRNDQLNGKYKKTPKVEEMAEKTGMLVLYKKTYVLLSKFVHSNMSVENFYLYQLNSKLYYDTKETDSMDFDQNTIRTTIDTTLYCFFLIIDKYCLELEVYEERLKKFREKFYLFVSIDLVSGKAKSNVDIALNLFKNLTGIDFPKEESDVELEVMFVQDDLSVFKKSWVELEALVRQKEIELETM